MLEVGATVAGYRIERLAGRGGMGVVYRATQLTLARPVALKVIAPEFAEDEDFRERFKRESRIAASIDHPNVLPVYEASEDNGLLYIAMRYVEGIDLGKLLSREGRLEPARAARIVAQVGDGLDAAHARGLVHRDVKPGNVLIAGSAGREHVYLTDFGLTKRSASTAGLTATGKFVGTIDYVAPEQLRGEHVDARADIYALGCVLYEVLTGRIPYPRDLDVAKLWAHMNEPPPAPSDTVPELREEFDQITRRAMAKSPEERFPSAGDLGRAALASAEGSAERAVRLEASRAWARPVLRAALLAAALAIVTLVGFWLLRDGGDEPEQAGTSAGRVVGRPIPVGSSPTHAAVGQGAVWIANSDDGSVSRIDARLGDTIGDPIRVGRHPVFLTTGHGSVWVANSEDGTVSRIDMRSNKVVKTIDVGGAPFGIATSSAGVWVADVQHDEVLRIDPQSNRVTSRPIPVGKFPFGVAVGEGAVWVSNSDDDSLTMIDPKSRRVVDRPLFVGRAPGGVAVGYGSVWVTTGKDDTVVEVDAQTRRMVGRPIRVGRFPESVAVGLGAVWVANENDGTISRIDPRERAVVGRPIKVGNAPNGPAVAGGHLWVPNTDDDTVTRIAPEP